MKTFEIVVPTLFGIEAITAREIRDLGYETTKVEDGRITFLGDAEAVALANLWLRTGERVLIKVGEFDAETFEELFEKCKALPWSDWITKHVAFPVKGFSIKSKLFSVSDCQAIIKKSVVEHLKQKYAVDWFDEQGALYQIQFSIIRNHVTLMLDTSGDGLHKRGYRKKSNAAPLRETVAAALLSLSFWKPGRVFWDPFCGSGTIPIEAALMARNRAPGLNRTFSGEKFSQLDKSIWEDARQEARELEREPEEGLLFGSDLDPACISLCKENAERAGVGQEITWSVSDALTVTREEENGILICNPPYGERMGDLKEAETLYRGMGKSFQQLPFWSYYILTSDEEFERCFGKVANKKRKLYNGMLKCDYYQYFGAKPGKVGKP